jgi:hypothetical protein
VIANGPETVYYPPCRLLSVFDPLSRPSLPAQFAVPDGVTPVEPLIGLVGGAVGAALTTLVIGAILVAIVPDYTERKMASLAADPLPALLYGVVCLVFAILVTVVLVFTVIGILLAIPLALVVSLLWAVGATIGYLTIADRLVSDVDGWVTPLAIAAALNGVLALTGIGGLVSFLVGAAGFGVVLRDVLE